MTPERLTRRSASSTHVQLLQCGSHRGISWEVRERWRHAAGPNPAARVPGHRITLGLPSSERIRIFDGDASSVAGATLAGYGIVVDGDGSAWHMVVTLTGAPVDYYLGKWDAPPWEGPVPTDDEAVALTKAWIDRAIAEGYAPDVP